MLRLHGFFASSAAYRVRIALHLKGLPFESLSVNLRAGAQHAPAHRALNPSGGVPVLEDGAVRLTQSLAIIDYLDRRWPEPRLLPADGPERDRALAIALAVACDVHPLNNLRVLQYLQRTLGLDDARRDAWYAHWIAQGFQALEPLVDGSAGWAVGSGPTLADCCLVPQVANALRWRCDVSPYPRIMAVHRHCMAQPAFQAAAPAAQPDFVP